MTAVIIDRSTLDTVLKDAYFAASDPLPLMRQIYGGVWLLQRRPNLVAITKAGGHAWHVLPGTMDTREYVVHFPGGAL